MVHADHGCSTKIAQDARDYAATLNDPTLNGAFTAQEDMAKMSDMFNATGQQFYVDAEKGKESNKAL